MGNFCDESHSTSNVIFIACPASPTTIYNIAYNKNELKNIVGSFSVYTVLLVRRFNLTWKHCLTSLLLW